MPKLLDVVAINTDLPTVGLAAGAEGTIVDDYGPAYMVEFLGADGYTVAVETVPAGDVTLVWEAPTVWEQSTG